MPKMDLDLVLLAASEHSRLYVDINCSCMVVHANVSELHQFIIYIKYLQ